MRIPEHIIDEIRTRTDIVDVIGEHVRLKKMSRNYLGLCPFHKEKTPSFNVNPERGIFKCFGCGKAGNAITFVEEYMHLGFLDAVTYLAKRTGIELPQEPDADPNGENARRTSALLALRVASEYYQSILKSTDGTTVRSYFEKRGFQQPIIDSFRLGASPAAWDKTMQYLLAQGFTIDHLVDAGLVIVREDGKQYDRFRGRAMFAIADEAGRVVGFSARTLENEPGVPKYVNSPQSIVFDKSRVLFGLDRAKRAIAEARVAVIVEGQADVISLHQADIVNVVATSGTALTPEQMRLLKRYADVIVLVFDSDEAGQNAITRGIEIGLTAGFDVRCVALPQGTDPDSYVREQGAEQFRALLDTASSWLEYQANRLENAGMLSEPVQQAKAVRMMLTWIAAVPDTLRHPFFVRQLADKFRLDEKYLGVELARIKPSQQRAPSPRSQELPAAPEENTPRVVAVVLPSERELLRVALTAPDGLSQLVHKYNVSENSFWSKSGQRIFQRILFANEEHASLVQPLLNDENLTPDERGEIADIVFASADPSANWKRFRVDVPEYEITRPIRDALLSIAIHRLHTEIETLTHEVENSVDIDHRKQIVFKLRALITKRETLRKKYADDPNDKSWLEHVSAS